MGLHAGIYLLASDCAIGCAALQTLIKYLPGFHPVEVLPHEADSHMQNLSPEQLKQQVSLESSSMHHNLHIIIIIISV